MAKIKDVLTSLVLREMIKDEEHKIRWRESVVIKLLRLRHVFMSEKIKYVQRTNGQNEEKPNVLHD